jgi:hypothetical protein
MSRLVIPLVRRSRSHTKTEGPAAGRGLYAMRLRRARRPEPRFVAKSRTMD